MKPRKPPVPLMLRTEGREWATAALAEENQRAPERFIEEHGKILHAIASNWDYPVDALIKWIHSEDARNCNWDAGVFRRHCQQRRADAAKAKAEVKPLFTPEGWPE